MLTFDHLKLIKREPRELARFRKHLMECQVGIMPEIMIAHEHDGSCCKREPWNETLATIVEAVNPPTRLVMINLPEGL